MKKYLSLSFFLFISVLSVYGTYVWRFSSDWKSLMNQPGGTSIQHYFNFFQSRPWFQIIPGLLSTIFIKGEGGYGQIDYAIVGSDENGKFIIAYIPYGRSFSINASAIKRKKLKASWFNPRDGAWRSIGNYAWSNTISFDTLDENDWVLVLDSSKYFQIGFQQR